MNTHLQAAYGIQARWYDSLIDPLFSFDRAKVVGELGGASTILELGVGTGLNLRYYAKGARVTGVDFSGMLAYAEKKRSRAGVTLVRADVRQLPFKPASFDAALATFLLRVTPEPGEVLREASRVVRPGGTLVVADVFAEDAPLGQRLVVPLTVLFGWGRNHSYRRLLLDTPWEIEETTLLNGPVRLLVLRNGGNA